MDNITPYLNGILLAYAAFLLGILSPGPNILAVIGTSMSIGRKQGMALAMGVSFGSFCWAILTVVGLSSLLAAYASALLVIKIVGGFYLLWLAYKAFKQATSNHDIEASGVSGDVKTSFGYFLQGLTVQMTNPKAAMSWIAIISLGLQADAPLWVSAAIVLGTGFMSILTHGIYALAFSTKLMVQIYSKARRWIQAVLGSFFTFVGLNLLFNRS